MVKNMMLLMVALTVSILMVVFNTAWGARPRISEAEACKMATAFIANRIAANHQKQGIPFRNIKVYGCRNFESISERGVAKITLSHSWEWINQYTGRNEWQFDDDKVGYTCNFNRTDQGWKIEQCR